jgi:hypothetical protein
MKRQRLPKGSSRKKEDRLKKTDWSASSTPKNKSMADLLEKKVYKFLHEAGHDIGKFDDKMHAYLHGLEERLEHAGHTTEEVWHKINSKDNYADFVIMPGRNVKHRIESMQSAEKIIYKLYPDAKIEWGLDPGVTDPANNKSFTQSFRVSNVSLGDIVTINNTMMQYGGGMK